MIGTKHSYNLSHSIILEQPGDTDEILLCDGCDLEIHLSCAGLKEIPTTDWLCNSCLGKQYLAPPLWQTDNICET